MGLAGSISEWLRGHNVNPSSITFNVDIKTSEGRAGRAGPVCLTFELQVSCSLWTRRVMFLYNVKSISIINVHFFVHNYT